MKLNTILHNNASPILPDYTLRINAAYIEKHKISQAQITDRISLTDKAVDITAEQLPLNDNGAQYIYSKFKMFLDNIEVGYMCCMPDNFTGLVETFVKGYSDMLNGLVYKCSSLCSRAGDQYQGIGTQLIKTAIQTSNKEGFDGKLFLQARNKGGMEVHTYRQNSNPIKFYRKLGFEQISDDLGNDYMILPEQARLNHLKDIEKTPFYSK